MSRVFISYAKEDGEVAQRLYRDLRKSGLQPWLDIEDLTPGARWRSAIKKAIEDCDYFVALLSSRSVNKRGYVQKEIRQALETLDTVPEDQIFIVPVRLDECKPSHSVLEDLHWLDLFPQYSHGLVKLLQAVRGPAGIGAAVTVGRDIINVRDTAAAQIRTGNVSAESSNIERAVSTFKVLVVVANPVDTVRIRVDQEAREISAVFGRDTAKGKAFEVKHVLSARVADLRQQLLEYRPQLVHISSHGMVDGVILEDENGRAQTVGTRTMRSLIHLLKEGLECVVINADFSEKMAEAISEDVGYVIGMSGATSDEAALRFSVSFYEALVAGKGVEFAFSYARSALDLEGHETKGAPRLFRQTIAANASPTRNPGDRANG